jgi:hypothetical protein
MLHQLMIHHDHRYEMLKKKTTIHITSMEIINTYLTVYLQRLKNKLAIDCQILFPFLKERVIQRLNTEKNA